MYTAILEIITIGFPFCIFKITAGLHWSEYWLIGLGMIDLLINVINLLMLLIKKRRIFDACILSFIVCFFRKPGPLKKVYWQDLGNSLDVILSFTIVAIAVGFGQLKHFNLSHIPYWNVAVVLNVFGAGFNRFSKSIKNLSA